MANEFIARKGLIALNNSQITGSLDVSGSLSITGISNVSASIAAAGGGGSDFPYTGSAIISGSLEVIGKVTGSVLIEGSGSTLFEVVGSEGQLFSITDSLSGSLFAVSDVSGLPILEVFSDDTVKIGSFNNEAITVSGSHTTIGGVLAIPGFTNVSASLAAAVAGGDNLGNHTATQNLNMGTYAITNVGNVDGVDVSTLKSDFDTLEGKTLISSSAQIDHDATTNFNANEHFTQANITTVGTVTSGDISAILPAGTVSGSSQTVANLDGQNVTVSRLTVKNSVDHLKLQNSAGTVTYVNFSPQGGLEIDLGGAGNSISASQDIKTHGDFIGENTHIKLADPNEGGGSYLYLSSSGDIAGGSHKLSLGDIEGGGNGTKITIDDSAEQISLSKALSVTGNITVTGTVDGVDIASLENSVQANDTEIASLTAATSSYLTSVPAGTISSSAQVDHDATTNFSADEHFTQANITTVGTVTSGDISAILPAGTVSGSAQITGFVDTSGTPASSQVAVFTDADTIQGTNKLIFANSALEVAATNSDSSTIKIYGGVVGSAQPYISPTGAHTNLRFGDAATNFTFDFQNNKIAFDQDSTNTYIMADTDTPENLEIHADGNIELRADDNLQVFSNIDVNSFAISNVTSITGSDSAAIELKSYPIGYEAVSAFPITGSGLIIRETGLPANNYPMLKIGDVELVDINSGLSPNVFFIHNVDSFLVASGSEPVNVFGDGPNKLFEHDGDKFKVYTKGIDSAKLTVESGSVTIASADLSLAGKLYNVANEATIDYIAGYAGLPNPSPTYELNVQSVSSVIANTNRQFDTGSSALASNGGSLGDIVKFGGSTTVAGGLYYLNSSGGWTLAQANTGGTSTGSLAVALGTNSTTDGMLLRGFVNPFALADAGIGAPVYISSASAGRFSGLLSQQTGEIVRVVGHAYGSDLIYFNPSNNWIEL